jgi:hypothetical protein
VSPHSFHHFSSWVILAATTYPWVRWFQPNKETKSLVDSSKWWIEEWGKEQVITPANPKIIPESMKMNYLDLFGSMVQKLPANGGFLSHGNTPNHHKPSSPHG